ncbi:MAG: CD225/dispanin family protein [Akkermansia sp.]|nr:CD225/dispanin family protein [Akkermansia sp.]
MDNTPTPPPPAAVQIPCPSNYLVLSILVTLLCCLPGGIIAIVYSCQVNSLYNAGKITEAQNASKWARRWNVISITSLAILFLIGIIGAIAAYPIIEEELRNNPELRQFIRAEIQRELHEAQDEIPVEMRDDIINETLDTFPVGR